MSSTLDPAKLKVVELRAELSKRGLDSKGNKPALVKRLKEALQEESKEEIPDTSIADTSTEDLDSSQTQTKEEEPITEETKPDKEANSNDQQNIPEPQSETNSEPDAKVMDDPPKEEKMETDEAQIPAEPPKDIEQGEKKPKEIEKETSVPSEEKVEEKVEPQEQEENTEESKETTEDSKENAEENKENGDQEEPKSRKSRWGDEEDGVESKQSEESSENNRSEPSEVVKVDNDGEPKGEKRRRSSPSPDRSQRRRSKSPVKEDEPPIDNDKVQLSWYDSDLHLQLDKESFLSAKPYHEGAFGFAWAGVRATHGVNVGKVCFEVKITEELKWEDFSKYYDKHRRDQHKSVSKHKSDEDKKKVEGELKKKSEEKSKEDDKKQDDEENKEKCQSENGEKTEALPENQTMELDESEKIEEKKNDTETEKVDESKQEEMDTSENKEQTIETKEQSVETKEQSVETKEQSEPLPTHLFRVGWSLLDTGLQLGEDKFSYGYESSGRFVTDKQFREYGVKFGVGDVIASFLSIDENDISITYSVNGVKQTEAITISKTDIPENFAFFPHVLSRNYAFELNLGSKEESWFPKPEDFDSYEFLDKIESKVAGPLRPENRSDCEVILMCGLPASGKTHWVREYVQSNPDKRYTLLGKTHLLEKMTVSGDTLKSKYKGSWHILLDKLQKCLNKLIEIAALRRRNYIIDQTNVFPSAQRRKLRPFEGFKRRAVVVVIGDEEQAKRQSLQEAQDGKDVPDSTVLEMKANMSLPQKGDWIDEVIYAGLGEEEAKAVVQKYNTQGREAGYGIQRRFSHRDDRHRWQNRRNDYRGGNYRDRNYHNNRYDRGPPRQGNWHPQRIGGWNRDRRDNRGPPMGGSRDWRNRGNGRDRGNRDSHGQVNSYNRNRNQPGRSPGGNWQPSNWGQNQGSWSNQPWGGQGSWGQGWSNQNQNQWKYGGGSGGQGYGSYSNWNYYGQYAQNWNPQGQSQSAGNPAGTNANQYGQYSQQEWAQYAQQYAQQGQNTSSSTTQSTPQK